MASEPVLKVAVDVPLSRAFDYLPPAGSPAPEPGCRVRVTFGRRRVVGVVLGHADDSDLPRSKLRRVGEAIDTEALLRDADRWLIGFTSDYYHHPIGEVVAAALPALLRQGRPLYPAARHVAATLHAQSIDVESLARRAPRQAELLETLLDAGGSGIPVEQLSEQMPTWRRIARPLIGKGEITEFDGRPEPPPEPDTTEGIPGPELNPDQAEALASIRGRGGFSVNVLDGVTGSGKTEVYLHLLADAIRAGRQALVLVPEIGLTPQLVARLRERLGVKPAILHSALTDAERLDAWRAAHSGDAKLVVGTRSAVFTPMPSVGLIVVDEEHDHSFKQQEGLRYSARDLALARGKHADIPVVLGSATPTIEVLAHCASGQYHHLRLPRRTGAAGPPDIRLVDTSRQATDEGLSEPLAAAAERHLDAGGQVLMFLNRRGFAPTLICTDCGHVAECARCDSRMTVHARDGRLRCHHCGASRALDPDCGECGSPVRPLGEGTQRLEDALRNRFPGRRIRRIDSDSTQGKGAIDEALDAAARGDADVLVGTQMLSKGHHFPKLTLVGIVNADQGLFGTDFRSDERLAQSVVQVAGRAGRADRRGEVLIQTAFPTHPFWRRLIDGGYAGVAARVLDERRETGWPPFSRLALIRAAAHKRDDAHAFLDAASRLARRHGAADIRVLGPVDAPMARRAGRYRAQLLLQGTDRPALHRLLSGLRPALEEEPAARKVRWSIDVDPIELF